MRLFILQINEAYQRLSFPWKMGYSPEEYSWKHIQGLQNLPRISQADVHKRNRDDSHENHRCDGLGTFIHLTGLIATLCSVNRGDE
ncbi:unnamed protein product [Allacma fusca]|uniref:Uncharacterized protein n=1 Tax=Allacma fusca TaxID=39272 RepID=A0A8J2NR26_9HEXA|nr:unnamed protein product [Allacma fusca]